MLNRVPKISFNPCFRGSRPRTAACEVCGDIYNEFQSLFSWKSPSDTLIASADASKGAGVSILVFVEVALGQGIFFALFGVSQC